MIEYPNGLVRAVTHYGVSEVDIDTVLTAAREVLSELRPRSVMSAAATS